MFRRSNCQARSIGVPSASIDVLAKTDYLEFESEAAVNVTTSEFFESPGRPGYGLLGLAEIERSVPSDGSLSGPPLRQKMHLAAGDGVQLPASFGERWEGLNTSPGSAAELGFTWPAPWRKITSGLVFGPSSTS